jgi:hypothetical protein
MKTVYIGTRTHVVPGRSGDIDYTTKHKGTPDWPNKIRCDKIDSSSAEQVDDDAYDKEGATAILEGDKIRRDSRGDSNSDTTTP